MVKGTGWRKTAADQGFDPKFVELVKDRTDEIMHAVDEFLKLELYVGVPASHDQREGEQIGNAAIAYIHDHGAPRAGIPQREFMIPGIEDAKESMLAEMVKGAKKALEGNLPAAEARFEYAGGLVAEAIKQRITAGIPPPLKVATVRNRWRKRKGVTGPTAKELLYGTQDTSPAALMASATPLINTASLLNSITYVVAKR
jgi:hypothetical protein